jgi:hypothetical protein
MSLRTYLAAIEAAADPFDTKMLMAAGSDDEQDATTSRVNVDLSGFHHGTLPC